ncbi:hypothetical protein THERU_07760 [Thermocrinis ruber]|uniref:Uncharacterized protein n=1 Tax=Thermocrinis ruber TaxID=75906 RepID=W0DE54_9AQUI|nr:hypothetical protein [Thermocrinis ruber]AHE96914.1 hypothetical protein THERU_07760 [Thermocrinis ruber]
MRITGELNKAELNIGKKGVGFNPSSQASNFEDVLNLIKAADISFNPAITPEGSLKVQEKGKEAPTTGKGQKSNDFLTNLSIFGLFAYGQIKQISEEENAKAYNVLNGTDTNLSTEEKLNALLVQLKSLKEQSQDTNNELFLVKPEASNIKVNIAQFSTKISYQTLENQILTNYQKLQSPLNINQTNAGNGLKNSDEPQTEEFAQGFFDGSELELYPKEEYTKADLRNNPATISLKVAKNVLEDLPQRVEKSELSPIEKSKKEEEHSHLYNMGVSPQRFEDKIENVQEVKNTKHFHTFHEAKSLYVKLEEGDFRIRVIKDAISVKVDFRGDFRPPTVQEVQNLIESLSKVGFRMEMLSLNGKNLQWEFRQGQEDKRGSRSREVNLYQVKDRQEFSLYL